MGKGKNTGNARLYFFDDKPIFGFDLGHSELRVVQFDTRSDTPLLKGYGSIAFPAGAIADGVITRPELIAKAGQRLFSQELVGVINSNRVAVSLPAGRAFTRAVQLPKLNPSDIDEAIHSETAQYIPIQAGDMYLDYTTLREDDDTLEVFVVAMPKKIVDSYLVLTRLMGLEAVLFDTAIGASAHLFALDKLSELPSVLVDFGASSTDITVYNRGLVVTGSVPFGGDDLTAAIGRALRISPIDAITMKSKYGLAAGPFYKQIASAVDTPMESLLKEIRRTIRYYEQRYSNDTPIGLVITMGGGANMPGLNDYLTDHLRLPTQTFDPVARIDVGELKSFLKTDHMAYITAAGLALTNPKDLFI